MSVYIETSMWCARLTTFLADVPLTSLALHPVILAEFHAINKQLSAISEEISIDSWQFILETLDYSLTIIF